jgi:hypothetical protein
MLVVRVVLLCVVVVLVRIVRGGERRELVMRLGGGQRSYVTTVVE